MLIYGGWSNERLLNLLKDKLVRRNDIKFSFACTDDASRDKSLHFVIHSGMYTECVLLELEGKGIEIFVLFVRVSLFIVLLH